MTETDFWDWFNDHLQKAYAATVKAFTRFTLIGLGTIALGFDWVQVSKVGQFGFDLAFSEAGLNFLLVVAGLASIASFFVLLGEVFRVVFLSAANAKNPYTLTTLEISGSTYSPRVARVLNRAAGLFGMISALACTVFAVLVFVAALAATINGLMA